MEIWESDIGRKSSKWHEDEKSQWRYVRKIENTKDEKSKIELI